MWRTGDRSLDVLADEVTESEGNGGIWIAPASNLTGRSGAWERMFSGEACIKWWAPQVMELRTTVLQSLPVFSSAAALCVPIRVAKGDYACGKPIRSGTAGKLNLDVDSGARLFAAKEMDALLNLEPGLSSFRLRGGIFDANGFLKERSDYLIAGISQPLPGFELASEVPAYVDLEGSVFRGDVGELSSKRKRGGHIHLEIKGSSADVDRSVRIVGNRFEGICKDYTTSITVHGRDDIVFSQVIVEDNLFSNVKEMAYIKHYRYCKFTENTGRSIKQAGLFTMNNNDLLRPVESLEPDNNLTLLVHGNTINTYGIALHIGASCGPYKITSNNLYGLDKENAGNTLINDNTIRDTNNTNDGGNFRSYGTYQSNTVKNAGRWGMNCNGTEVQILDNQFINCKEASLAVRGAQAFQNIIDRNLFNGAPLLLWNNFGKPASHARLQIFGENNQFINITGEPIIVDERSLGSVNMWTRRPVVAKTWSAERISDKIGLLSDIVLLDTRSNAVVYELPSTQKVGPGQRVVVAHDIGANPATVEALNSIVGARSVDIAANTILISPKIDAWTSVRPETASAIRIADNGGTPPSPLVAGRPYFLMLNVDPGDSRKISLADSEVLAKGGSAIDLRDTGSGASPTYGDILYNKEGSPVATITLSASRPAVFVSGRGCWYQL